MPVGGLETRAVTGLSRGKARASSQGAFHFVEIGTISEFKQTMVLAMMDTNTDLSKALRVAVVECSVVGATSCCVHMEAPCILFRPSLSSGISQRIKALTVEYYLSSYVLDLRAKFVPRETAVAEYELWRHRALELEQKLQAVEERYQSEHVELAALQVKLSSTVNNDTKAKGQKKAAQKKSEVPAPTKEPFSSTFNHHSLAAFNVPPLSEGLSVLASLQNLEVLIGHLHDHKHKLPDDAFNLAWRRALDALAALLPSVLLHDRRAATNLDALSRLLPQVATLVLPILAREPRRKSQPAPTLSAESALDHFLGYLTTQTLTPLIQSFPPLSNAFYSAVLLAPRSNVNAKAPPGRPATSSETFDIRPPVSSLIQLLMQSVLGAAKSSESAQLATTIAHMVDFLTLKCIHELDRLYPDPDPRSCTAPSSILSTTTTGAPSCVHSSTPPPIINVSQVSSTALVSKLARKDALWYICSTLHAVLDVSMALDGHETYRERGALLQDPIYTALSELLRRTCRPVGYHTTKGAGEETLRAGSPQENVGDRCGGGVEEEALMDDAEREMMLAVVEKYWLKVA
ncbi:hypothetical protein BXZ70DRAFT_1019379 [Cristinia sonorae]|uniref:Uncharacterized protein n=1 Tax=Cristinia sonorae TaxID=1940300 RepID=A0A8K0USG4_9AGAR|nr:hypothetical protein BXZ70DRAFT_1019379 [Cristinia sonorae]